MAKMIVRKEKDSKKREITKEEKKKERKKKSDRRVPQACWGLSVEEGRNREKKESAYLIRDSERKEKERKEKTTRKGKGKKRKGKERPTCAPSLLRSVGRRRTKPKKRREKKKVFIYTWDYLFLKKSGLYIKRSTDLTMYIVCNFTSSCIVSVHPFLQTFNNH